MMKQEEYTNLKVYNETSGLLNSCHFNIYSVQMPTFLMQYNVFVKEV